MSHSYPSDNHELSTGALRIYNAELTMCTNCLNALESMHWVSDDTCECPMCGHVFNGRAAERYRGYLKYKR